jgi:hypothetical protein
LRGNKGFGEGLASDEDPPHPAKEAAIAPVRARQKAARAIMLRRRIFMRTICHKHRWQGNNAAPRIDRQSFRFNTGALSPVTFYDPLWFIRPRCCAHILRKQFALWEKICL